ncbi:MAG: hypothetical protein IKS65_09810 [Bacteroidales bacterium]|nr:hypothetical protein [Bacteroidales bacterium]
MIDMDKKEQILHYHRIDGLSLREIARRTGLNRKTVAHISPSPNDFTSHPKPPRNTSANSAPPAK